MDLDKIKRIAIRAAYRAGKILNGHFGHVKQLAKKGVIDLVTEADLEAEQSIIATIRDVFPNHDILAEESGNSGKGGPNLWIIDPLDGTTNFAHNLPIYAVSIAYAQNDTIMLGLVFNPNRGELFLATRGQGASLNGQPIHVSSTCKLNDSLLVTGFPYTITTRDPRLTLARFERCLKSSQGVRRLGSAALDLCWVACGRFEGFWEENLKPWDTAAGLCIVEEAGGKVTNYEGHPYKIGDWQILATNSHVHREMVGLLDIKGER
jgi:myo-inositol-1(or 4)-monophosphatase